VKSVRGAIIQAMGAVQATIYEGSVIQFSFQLVDKRVDLPCDGTIWNFFAHADSKIYYETGVLTVGTGSTKIHKELSPINAKGQKRKSGY